MQATICKLKCNEAKVKFPNKGSCITHGSQWGLICPLSNSAHGPWRDFCQRLNQHCLSRWCVPKVWVRLCKSESGAPLSRPKITSQSLIKYVLMHQKKSLTGLNYWKVRRRVSIYHPPQWLMTVLLVYLLHFSRLEKQSDHSHLSTKF